MFQDVKPLLENFFNHYFCSIKSLERTTIPKYDLQFSSNAIPLKQNLSRKPNTPTIYFDRHFQQSMTVGLRWLVTEDTIYKIY